MTSDAQTKLCAPGVPEAPSERDRAIALARTILRSGAADPELVVLARQFLRTLGLS